MFLSTLLEASAKTTNIVKWCSVVAVVLLLALLGCVGLVKRTQSPKRYDAKRVALGGVCVASSFVLALIKYKPVQYGGSITLASFVPVLIYAYAYGAADGFLVGILLGLFNFVESPYILNAATFLFDYLFAFASVGIMGFFGKLRKKEKSALPVVLGCICVFGARFLSHLISGMVFFTENAVWVSLPDWAMGNAFIYSFIYQCIYVPTDALIATLTLTFLAKTGVLDKLIKGRSAPNK